jgi:hypothetical protein
VLVVAGFLADAARTGLSQWTTVNVLRQWATEGITRADMLTAARHVRVMLGHQHQQLLADYERAIKAFIPAPPG